MPDSCPVCFPAGADPSPSGGKVTMVRNLKLLLWKNFILKKRKTLITVLEILMPLLFSMIIMYLRLNSLPKKIPPVNYPAINISLLPAFLYFPTYTRYQLVYVSSKSETLKTITEAVGKSFDVERGIHKMRILGHSSVPLFENYILQDPKAVFVLAGIVFDHTFNDSKQPLPLKVKYRLRFSYTQRNFLIAQLTSKQDYVDSWGTSFLYPPNPSQEPRALGHSDGGLPGYSNEGFLAIQHALDKAIMHYHAHNGTTEMFEGLSVLVKRFPHGAHVQDGLLVTLQNEFPLLLMLSFICIELIIINSVALEKEKKLKEYMCMMGVDNWQHWAAWFIVFFVSALLAVSFMTVLFCTQVRVRVAVFRNSDPSLIFVFLLSFAMATVFFAFMISTFFQKAHVATASGGIIFFLTYLPYLYLTFSYSQRTHFQKIGFCLLSNVAMALGVRFISIFEIRGTGLQWKNVGGFSGELNFCQVLLMLLLDSVLYGAVAGYVEAVLPGEHGVPKPWYFFVMPSHWRGQPVPLTRSVLHVADPDNSPKSQLIQEEPTSLKKGIEIQHLYKVSNKHVAVKDLTLNLYQGQITALLGHNGAGKTTTCYVLTGLIPPSSGCVYINGYEISHNMAEIRKSMGWCPQHDILFDDLTVAEHLSFYAQLKGLSRLKCPEEVQRMLHALSLEDKRDSLSRCLSGGLRRKLSIGIALIAGSKVLMLDEPTSGMDAVSRRAIWDLLQQHKSQRTVLLTTHFMDEADLLGDRVAIMAKGELQCCGSSLFLKQKYGAGYYMTLVKKPHCSTEKIAHLIYHHIPNAVLQSSIGEELTFILPKKSMPRFASLFTELEQRQVELGIASFGASVTTMEEVFIRVNKLTDSSTEIQTLKIPSIQSHHLIGRVPVNRIKRIHSRIFSIPSGLLICQQFYAMLLKRVLYSWRNWLLMLTVQVLVPLLITTFSLTIFNLETNTGSVPLELTLSTYGRTVVPFYISPNSRLGPRLSQHFTDMLVAEEQIPLETLSSVEDLLLDKAEEEPESFDFKYVVAASFEDQGNHTTVTALFNNQAYHSPAVALALVDNFLFKLLSGAAASITASNHPQPKKSFPRTPCPLGHLFFLIRFSSPKGHYLVTNLLFGIAFLSSSFAILTVKERSTKAKHIQFVSGVYVATFWLSALLWDLITSLVPTLLLLVVFLYHQEEAFTHQENVQAIILVLMLYSWASIPLVYLSSFCFRKEGSAFVKLLVMLTFLSHTRVSESLDHAFLMLPGHCLGMALFNLHYNHGLQKLCKTRNLSQSECNKFCEYQRYMVQESVYAWESLGMGKYLAALAVLGSVYLILLFLIETNVLRELKARFSDLNGNRDLPQNGDDKHRGDSGLLIPGLLTERLLSWAHQVYGRKVPLLAVNKVSFAVQAEECFGLLGVNGAGKTSIFKMLTGEEPITSGDAFIKGLSISSHLRKVRQWVGYCPQSDTLLNHMTGWETLVMYARIRGIPERHIGTCVEQILEELLMYTYTDKLVKTYRHLNCSRFADKPQSSAATHTQQLAWLSSPSRATPALTGTRRLLRAGSVLEDEHQGMVHYHLPGEDLSWAKVFDILEQAKRKFMLDDYSVNQVSLEDIFLSFTYPISVRGRGLGVALDQIGTSHLGGLVDSPGASPWEKIPLSPT
uniref:ABC transporter domain-containing protein n=1 Tax=Panthera leo TaxID=9689 RepID=A0A8C8Y9L1_PANLE